MRVTSWSKALACVLLLTGCASSAPLMLPRVGSGTTCITPAPEADLLIGIALSGGGSRAAVFGAAGLEALGRLRAPGGGSLLEETRYLSSVSGGSVAGAYYASHKPPKEVPVLTPQGDYTREYQAFFKLYSEQLSQNIEGALIRRQLGSFRWLNSALAARSLQEVLQEKLLGDTTLGALSARQARGDIPAMMFNASLFNDGRRMIMTTLPQDVARYDVSRGPEAGRGRPEPHRGIRAPDAEDVGGAHGGDSARPARRSVPPPGGRGRGGLGVLPAPGRSHHLPGPGGAHLLACGGRRAVRERGRRDAGVRVPEEAAGGQGQAGAHHLARQLVPVRGRGAAPWPAVHAFLDPHLRLQPDPGHHGAASLRLQPPVHSLLAAGWCGPGPQHLPDHVSGPHRPAVAGRPERSPRACRSQEPPLQTPLQITERLAEIPTRLKIFSECDRQLLVTSANKVVAQAREEIEAFLAGQPFPERTAR